MPLKSHPIKSIKPTKVKRTIQADEPIIEKKVPVEVLDSQKEFFRLMAEKIREDGDSTASSSPSAEEDYSRSTHIGKVSHYKKMFFRFTFLVVILVLAILYFSVVKMEVAIKSEQKAIDDSVNFYAYSDNTSINLERSVKATINRVELEASKEFPSTGQKNIDGQITGKVKLINNYTKNQPLVATTRILSPDNKLFRLKNTVTVPAGGSIEAEIYADDNSAAMAIAPTKFIIPGLWEGIQSQIYAESYEAFSFSQESDKFISQSDIDDAVASLNSEMIKQAEEKANNQNSSQKNIFSVEPSSIKVEVDKEVGEKTDKFTVKIKGVVNTISLNEEDVIEVIKHKLAILDFNQDRSQVNSDSLKYELLSFNSAKSLAEIKVNFSAQTSSIEENNVINKEHLVNLSEKQIRAYLDGLTEIDSYDLTFKPSFFKRAPMLSSRINISFK